MLYRHIEPMAIDPELLSTAAATARRLADAERQAELARADYHTAVRRLHLAGASLREIAAALDISHQRVQQIVDAAGGSWWRRGWGTRSRRPDAGCTWCGRPPGEVDKLIAGPRVYICDRCVAAAESALSGRPKPPFQASPSRALSGRCSFCGKRESSDRRLAPSPSGRVCNECLTTCREILDASP